MKSFFETLIDKIFCRLTLYPEFALEPETWLDSSRGRNSIAAAVLRQSDAHGLLRGSNWVAGQTSNAEETDDSLQTTLSRLEASAALPPGTTAAPTGKRDNKQTRGFSDAKREHADIQMLMLLPPHCQSKACK